MEIRVLVSVIPSVVISIMVFTYVGYCWVRQRVHVRGKGWRTKEEAPRAFYLTIILLIVLGVGNLFSTVYFNLIR